MRDIKFRAWHNESKEYCEGSTSNMFAWLEDGQDVTLEQFTGLKGKNGVEIYEGDIIHNSNFTDDCNHMVDMIEDLGQWFMVDTKDGYAEPLCDWLDSSLVIGNIHKNPELLGD